jgi:hypothetical protein
MAIEVGVAEKDEFGLAAHAAGEGSKTEGAAVTTHCAAAGTGIDSNATASRDRPTPRPERRFEEIMEPPVSETRLTR